MDPLDDFKISEIRHERCESFQLELLSVRVVLTTSPLILCGYYVLFGYVLVIHTQKDTHTNHLKQRMQKVVQMPLQALFHILSVYDHQQLINVVQNFFYNNYNTRINIFYA